MPRYFLGLDVGGTKTHALVADEFGRALGFGVGGPGNPQGVGYEGLTRAVVAATHAALAAASLSQDQIVGAGFGIAGFDWPSQRGTMLRALDPLGLHAPLKIVNDTLVGLLAGAEQGGGVAVVAGTGCNCRGWDVNRREGRATGMGDWSGEAAGAYDVVVRALQAVSYEWTRRGPATRLTQAFVELTGARDTADLIEGLATRRYPLDASAAPLVFRVAAEGDPAAQAVIRWAGGELGGMAVGVIRQLNFEPLAFEVVLVGSLYAGGSILVESMRETIQAVAPAARLVRLTAPPVVGGVLLGMEQAGMRPSALRRTLARSTSELLNGAAAGIRD